MYQLTFHEVIDILKKHKLLREIVHHGKWIFQTDTISNEPFTQLDYNSKQAQETSLFFCKGITFEESYLLEAIERGVRVYISETLYQTDHSTAIVVSDVRKSMALIAKAFYKNPQDQLTLIGITGTKGKTTTTYLASKALQAENPGKTAIISTIEVNLDGQESRPSNLTTPEALDLFAMFAEAVRNNMTYLVMEVSSQAYKTRRVYDLTFDIGVFLNISPDHIGPNEHPDFEDYFYCKRQLLSHSRQVVINSESDYARFLIDYAKDFTDQVYIYGKNPQLSDYVINSDIHDNLRTFTVEACQEDSLNVSGTYSIELLGEFNKENALAAIIIAGLLHTSKEAIAKGLENVSIPGRMEHFTKGETHIYVDFAHNYISLKTLIEYALTEHPDLPITVLIGAPGGKGVSRRVDMGRVLNDFKVNVILTEDDPDFESPKEIAQEIAQEIEDKDRVAYVEDRQEAIRVAIEGASEKTCVLIAGKGDDQYIIRHGVKDYYVGDSSIVKKYIG